MKKRPQFKYAEMNPVTAGHWMHLPLLFWHWLYTESRDYLSTPHTAHEDGVTCAVTKYSFNNWSHYSMYSYSLKWSLYTKAALLSEQEGENSILTLHCLMLIPFRFHKMAPVLPACKSLWIKCSWSATCFLHFTWMNKKVLQLLLSTMFHSPTEGQLMNLYVIAFKNESLKPFCY